MKKLLMAFFLLIFASSNLALAENFNYSSEAACRNAMYNYANTAQELANQNKPNSVAWTGYTNMASFFNSFANNADSSVACTNGECIYKATLVCSLITDSSQTFWNNSIVPILQNEANYLNNQQFDKTLPNSGSFSVECKYKQEKGNDWENCIVK